MVTKEGTETTTTTVTLVEGDDEKAYYVSAVFALAAGETSMLGTSGACAFR